MCAMVESCLDKVNRFNGKMASSVFTHKTESHTGSIQSKTSPRSRRSNTSTMIAANKLKQIWLVCFAFYRPFETVFQSISGRLPKRGERGKKR